MDFQRGDKEPVNEYILRIIKECREQENLTWKETADIINDELGLTFAPDKYRSQFRRSKNAPEYDDYIERAVERTKNRDILNQANAYLRRISREDTIVEIARDFALEMSSKKLLPIYFADDKESIGDNEAILCISDWHYGIEIDNYWNKYNTDIAKDRICKLRDMTIQRCLDNGVGVLHVVNLSDLIAGRIHAQIRYQSRVDVITQAMEISEILAEFLTDLSKYFKIEYRDCLDNHSRIEPNKKESMDLESLVRIITWYLKERLKSTDIDIHDNEFGEDIISFNVLGHRVCAVHGDKDKPETVIKNLTLMTKEHWDLILSAHRHHFSADETNETLVVSNGSLMGTDSYAASLRLSSLPTQNLIICTEDNVAECIYRLIIK